MKNILLLVHDDEGQEARLQAALDVARAMGGHLRCLDVSILPALVDDYYSGAGEALLLAEEHEREVANRRRIEQRLAREDVPWDWTDITGALVPCLTETAALMDLIVVNRRLDSFPVPDMRGAVSAVLIKAHKPILAVPEGTRGLNLGGRVLVAWDGSAPVEAAMRAAVPLLKFADTVTLFEVDDGSIGIPAEEAAAYLSRHGVHAAIHRRRTENGAGKELLTESRGGGWAYIVMGGFSHSRWREAMFGGVTRRMLSESSVPLFLAH